MRDEVNKVAEEATNKASRAAAQETVDIESRGDNLVISTNYLNQQLQLQTDRPEKAS